MKVTIDLHEKSTAQQFSAMLNDIKGKEELLDVELKTENYCPNRVVPILAMSDEFRDAGGKVVFSAKSEQAREALAGFIDGDMRPKEGISDTLGRVWRFDNDDELNMIVNATELELSKTARLAKGVKLCFIWCLNEVMDNVLNHSGVDGNVSGYVMVQYLTENKLLKVCVFDLGIGLKESFTGSRYSPKSDAEAIELAIRQNVTSGNGQGNGLWGLRCLVGQSPKGKLHIRSGSGEYLYNPLENIESSRECLPLIGHKASTLVDFQIVCDGELSFEKVFPDALGLVDIWAENRESESGAVCVKVLEIVSGCGTRDSGKKVRTVVENLIEADGRKVVIDFDGAETCSSAFVDELVGKLLERYGFAGFVQKVSITNMHGIVALLLNHSVRQRLSGENLGVSLELGPTGESSADYTAMGDDNATKILAEENHVTVDISRNEPHSAIKGVFKEAKE